MVPITVMQMETSYENLQSASALNNCVYEEKNKSYYGLVRHDVLRLVPHGTKRLLDVGCWMSVAEVGTLALLLSNFLVYRK